jgi:hypothetical protein
MRKIISVLLVTLMLFSVVAVSASAADGCGCTNHIEDRDCRCCINCTKLDKSMVMSCAKDANGNLTGKRCCAACAGYLQKNAGCGCSCSCCGDANSDTNDGGFDLGDVVTDKDKQNFVDIFQSILGKISAAFDNFFNAIFEFLKLDDGLGRN